MSRDRLAAIGDAASLFEFGEQETIEIPHTALAPHAPQRLREKCGSLTLPRPFVAEFRNADLVGPAAIGHLAKHGFILDTSPGDVSTLMGSLGNWEALFAGRLPSFARGGVAEYDCACCLVNIWSSNYFHWVIEGLTRLEGLRHYERVTGRKPVLIIDDNAPQFVLDSLEMMGFRERVVPWRSRMARAERLVVPSFRRLEGRTSAKALDVVRAAVRIGIPEHAPAPLRNLFVSRRKAARRRVLNEREVLDGLGRWGFEPVVLEDLTFREQVALFSQARCVVAPHGAGLTNMLWSDAASIVELFGATVVPCYFTLAHALGSRYACVSVKARDDDLEVDVTALEAALEGVLTP